MERASNAVQARRTSFRGRNALYCNSLEGRRSIVSLGTHDRHSEEMLSFQLWNSDFRPSGVIVHFHALGALNPLPECYLKDILFFNAMRGTGSIPTILVVETFDTLTEGDFGD